MNSFLKIILILDAISLTLIACSPFRYDDQKKEYTLSQSIAIQSSCETVYEYLGNSEHASDWSIFVHHITPLNPDEYSDGEQYSKRRCFKNSDEQGLIWDEEIIDLKPNQYRTLSIYNLQGFPIESENLITKQVYECLNPMTTTLSLTLHKDARKSNWIDWIKLKVFGHYIDHIFQKNLNGIKREVEKI